MFEMQQEARERGREQWQVGVGVDPDHERPCDTVRPWLLLGVKWGDI